jgi:hypothetical protein
VRAPAVVPNAQAVDEHIDQPQYALLPSRLIVRVAHADKRAQQIFGTDVVANFTGRDRAIEQAAMARVRLSYEYEKSSEFL